MLVRKENADEDANAGLFWWGWVLHYCYVKSLSFQCNDKDTMTMTLVENSKFTGIWSGVTLEVHDTAIPDYKSNARWIQRWKSLKWTEVQ